MTDVAGAAQLCQNVLNYRAGEITYDMSSRAELDASNYDAHMRLRAALKRIGELEGRIRRHWSRLPARVAGRVARALRGA